MNLGQSTFATCGNNETHLAALGVGSDSKIYALHLIFRDGFRKLHLVSGLTSTIKISDISLTTDALLGTISVNPNVSVSVGGPDALERQ